MSTQETLARLQQIMLEPGSDPVVEQAKLQSLVLTRIATFYELDRKSEVSEIWEANANILDTLLHYSPDEAFAFSMELVKLPYRNYNAEFFRGWLRGNGLALLSEPQMTLRLLEHISQPEDTDFIKILSMFLSANLFLIKTPENLADYSMGFNAIAALKVSLHLIDASPDKKFNTLRMLVQKKLQDPDIHRIIGFFMNDEETRPFVEEVAQRLKH